MIKIFWNVEHEALSAQGINGPTLHRIFSHTNDPSMAGAANWCSSKWFNRAMPRLVELLPCPEALDYYYDTREEARSQWGLNRDDHMIMEWWINRCDKAGGPLRPIVE